MTTKRERQREYERRRYEKRLVRIEKNRRRRRLWTIVVSAIVAVVVVGIIVVVNVRGSSNPTASAGASASTADTTGPSAIPSAAATVPAASLAEGRTWTGTITLGQGALGIELDGAKAPQAVANFTQLAAKGFYNGLTCHRLATSIKVLQCGDPKGDGTGGPGYSFGPIENAPADNLYPEGTLAMARVSGDAASQGSQFFILYGDAKIPADSAGGYTVFGKVTSGLDVVKAIAALGTASGSEKPAQTVTIEKVETK